MLLPLDALFYFMSVQKRFYDSNGCQFIIIQEDEGLLRFICYNECLDSKVKLFDVYFDDDTALELSREIYHTIKNLRNGGGNER